MSEGAEIFELTRGMAPLVISIPHDGREVPATIARRMTDAGRALEDTDWYVGRLYSFAADLDATVVVANYSRYVVDLNRPADGATLYPGQRETGLCPTSTFSDQPIYRDGAEPGDEEVADRIETYWRPYHDRLAAELDRLREHHGRVLLWDAHSIRSQVPRFFSGTLPDFNFGSDSDRTLAATITEQIVKHVQSLGHTAVSNGRFKGGHITRHYGDPERSVYALQLELSQRTYLNESTTTFEPALAGPTGALISELIRRVLSQI